MSKKWKKLEQEIARLKQRRNRWKNPFPDLSIEQRTAPLGNQFAPIVAKCSRPADAKIFPVGYSHKSSLQLITDGMISNGELKWMSGKKT